MTVGVGIAGYGLSGSVFHAPLIGAIEGFRIKAIMTSRHDIAQQHWPEARVVAEFDALVSAPDIDLIVLGLPNFLHYELTRRALEAGKHVVVEKPFVPTSLEGAELIALAKERNLLLTVFHNRRWDGDYMTIRNLMRTGQLGEIMLFEAHFDRYKASVDDRWKERRLPGGGVLYDLGAHLIDQALQLFGAPEAVFADVQTQRQGAVNDDYFHLILQYGSMRAVLHASMLVPAEPYRYLVHGRRATFLKAGIDPQEARLKNGPHCQDWSAIGVEDACDHGVLTTVEGDKTIVPTEPGRYLEFYNLVLSRLRGGGLAPVAPEEANQVVRVIELSQQSSAERRWIAY